MRENPATALLTRTGRKLLHGSKASLNTSPSRNKILLIVFVLSLAFYPILTPQSTESHAKPPWIFDSIPVRDFRVGATLPNTVPADGTPATSIIFVSPINDFNGTVALSDLPLPAGLFCTAIVPATIPDGSGTATTSCSSRLARTYRVAIIGTSGEIRHNATAIFTFAAFTFPDFEISAGSGSINIEAGNPGMTRIIVTPTSGFTGAVTLAVAAPAGISCNLSPTSIQSSGTSTLTCNSGRPGEYTITITATGGTSTHTATINVHVATLSPAAPAPSTILGLAPATLYVIIAGIIAVVAAGAVLFLRLRGSLARGV